MRRRRPQRHLNTSVTYWMPRLVSRRTASRRFARLEPHLRQQPDVTGSAGAYGLLVRPLKAVSCIGTLRIASCLSPSRSHGSAS
jgi:hypothetical protein